MVLDRWEALTESARCAAQRLYSIMAVGDVFTIVHRQFHEDLPCKDEGASRRAFKRLISLGLVQRVVTHRGRRGCTIYRLLDASQAYINRGLRPTRPDPQQLLAFEIERAEREDLEHGVIRLFDGNAARAPHLTSQPTGGKAAHAPHLTHEKSGARAAFNADPTAGSEQNQPFPLESFGDDGSDTRVCDAAPTELAPTDRESLQSGTRQGIECTTGSKSSAPTVPTGGDAGRPSSAAATGGLEAAGCPPPQIGTPDATRLGARAPRRFESSSSKEEEDLITTNQIPNPNPTPKPIGVLTTLGRARPEPGFDQADPVDAMIGTARDAHAELARKTRRTVLQAVRAAERKTGITSADHADFMHQWVADEWGFQHADAVVEQQDVDELVGDLQMLAKRQAFTTSPGAFAQSRLRKITRRAGVEIRSSSPSKRKAR